MADFVPLLAGIALLLTAGGTWKFVRLFYPNDAIYAGLLSGSTVIVYVILFDFLMIAAGVAALVIPIVVVARRFGWQVPVPGRLQPENVPGGAELEGDLDAYSDWPRCPSCDAFVDTGDQHCTECGQELPG